MSVAINEMFGWVALVLVAVVIIMAVASNFSFLEDIRSCPEPGEPIPPGKPWCLENDSLTYYDDVAMNSARALVCAINSVSTGDNSECSGGESKVVGNKICFGDVEEDQACVSCDSSLKNKGIDKGVYFGTVDFEEYPAAINQLSLDIEKECKENKDYVFESINADYSFYYGLEGKVIKVSCSSGDEKSDYYHLTFSEAAEQCGFEFDNFVIESVSIVDKAEAVDYNNKDLGIYFSSSFNGVKCNCNQFFGNSKMSYDVYAADETKAGYICEYDFKKYNLGVENNKINKHSVDSCTDSGSVSVHQSETAKFMKYTCNYQTSDLSSCDVTNFQIPQTIDTGIDDYILFMGFPERMIYWQQFPLDEDTWSEKSNFKVYTLLGLATIVGPSKFLKLFKGSSIGSKITTATGKLSIPLIGLSVNRISLVTFNTLRGSFLAFKAMEYEMWKNKMDEVTYEFLKPHSNEIVFLKALEGKQGEFDLSSEIEDKPVLLRWVPGFALNQEKNLHFVSPCYIKKMDVSKTIFGCQEYRRDEDLGTVECITDHEGVYNEYPEDVPRCETFKDPTDSKYIRDNNAMDTSEYGKVISKYINYIRIGKMPGFMKNDKFYNDGFYEVPIEVTGCDIGTSCERTVTFFADSKLLFYEEGKDNRYESDKKTNDYFLIKTEYIDSEGSPKSDEEKVGITKIDTSSFQQYSINYISDNQEFYIWLKPENAFKKSKDSETGYGVNGDISKDEDKYYGKVSFSTSMIENDGTVSRSNNIVYNTGTGLGLNVGVFISDEGSNGKISNIRISDLTTIGTYSMTSSYYDKDNDGNIDVYGLKYMSVTETTPVCMTEGIVIDNVDINDDKEDYGKNYCVREQSTLSKIGEVAGWVGITASMFTGGLWSAGWIVVGTVGEYHGVQGDWPDGGMG